MTEGSGYYVNNAIREAVEHAKDSPGDTMEVGRAVSYNTFLRHRDAYEGVVLKFDRLEGEPTTPAGNSSGSRLGTVLVMAVVD